jgi:hypothetical protein
MQPPVSDPRRPAAPHLDAERLAALADEPPSVGEAAHLAACAACRREREAYVALVTLARAEGAGDDAGAAWAAHDGGGGDDAAWARLAAALRAEGLADGPAPGGSVAGGAAAWGRRPDAARARRRGREWPLSGWSAGGRRAARLAAAALLAVGAAAGGRLSATHGPLAVAAAAPGAVPQGGSNGAPDAAPTGGAAALDGVVLADLADAALAGAADAAADVADPERLRERVAALDAVLPRVRAAARRAPEDPAVNQLYLTAYDAREAALRELGRALPDGARLTGY